MLWWSPVTGSRSRSTNEWREASVLHVTACYRRNASPSASGDRELLLARPRSRTANFVTNLPYQNDAQCMLICYLYTCNWEGFNVFLQHSKVSSLSYPFQFKKKVGNDVPFSNFHKSYQYAGYVCGWLNRMKR